MWGGVADVINCAKLFENPSKGFGAVRHRKIAFPIEIVHRPYNSVGTTVPHCDGIPSHSYAESHLPLDTGELTPP